MSLFSGGRAQAQQQTVYTAIQLQTSTFGKVVALIYGTTRVAANLIWYGDFTASAVKSSGGGGKGGAVGGGGKGGGSATYTYAAAVAMALGEGPIAGIGSVFVSKTTTTLAAINLSLFIGPYPQTPWSYLETNHQAIPELHTIPSSSPYTVTVTYASPFIADFGVVDGAGTVFTRVSGAPAAAFQYAVNAATGTYSFYAANAGDAITISYTAGNQQPPNQALGYNGIAYLAGYYHLGSSAELPNHNFEVQGILSASVPGAHDADPSAVIADFLTNPHYGAGFPSARLGDLSTYQAYCLATGLLISPAYSDQDQASKLLDDIATATNSAWVWSSGALTLVPYGDQAVTGNGKTYAPPSAPLYDLTDDDFLPNTLSTGTGSAYNTDPVSLVRKRPSDQINSVKLEYLNRANQYNAEIVEAKDEAMINLYGLRAASSQQMHLFCDAAAARQSAQLQLQRQAIRNLYSFTLDQRYILLDPMDIVSISDAALGLVQQWVRILEITEDDEGNLAITAEEYLAGTGSAALYSFNTSYAYAADYNAAPPSPNTPLIFEPSTLLTGGALVTWLVASGPAGWGGADAWVSSDNATYKLAGRIKGSARMGVLTATLPVGADPDTTDTLKVNLTQSNGQLLPGTQSDADLYHTLCIVDGELVSYETATLTGSFGYNLAYLRRGAYGTTIASHASGAPFGRLDQGAGFLAFPYTPAQIGQIIYVKLTSFNLWEGGEQELSEVEPYTHVIEGPPTPGTVQNFSAQINGDAVLLSWTDLADYALKGYDILYGPQAAPSQPIATLGGIDLITELGQELVTQGQLGGVASARMLTEASRATSETTVSIPPGNWTVYIRGHDIADQVGPVSSVNISVANVNGLIAQQDNEPDWLGTASGFLLHYSGLLVPDSTKLASAHTNAQLFEQFVPFGVTGPTYAGPSIDTGIVGQVRAFATVTATAGRGVAGTPMTGFLLDAWSTGSDPGTFAPWTVGYVSARYLRGQIQADTAVPAYISAFDITVDAPVDTDIVNGFAVASGGTALSFAAAGAGPFHVDPNVQVTPADGVLTSAGASAITTTGCTIQGFVGSTPTAGVVNITITGN